MDARAWYLSITWIFVHYGFALVLHYSFTDLVSDALCRSLDSVCSCAERRHSTQLRRQLQADLVANCLFYSLKSQNLATLLVFHLFLKRTLGQINKIYTKNQVRNNCTIYVKIGDLLFFFGFEVIFAKCGHSCTR